VIDLYWWAVFIAVIVQLLTQFQVLDTRNRIVWTIADFLYRITEPALRPIRQRLPQMGGLDLSPLVLLIAITALGCWAFFELGRRIPPLRIWIGLPSKSAKAS
jgi:YggT family protein